MRGQSLQASVSHEVRLITPASQSNGEDYTGGGFIIKSEDICIFKILCLPHIPDLCSGFNPHMLCTHVSYSIICLLPKHPENLQMYQEWKVEKKFIQDQIIRSHKDCCLSSLSLTGLNKNWTMCQV
jgi:hypothetical protein